MTHPDYHASDIFSSDVFLNTLARSYFKTTDFEIKNYNFDGQTVRLLSIDGKPVIQAPFYDYILPQTGTDSSTGSVRYIPRLVTDTIPLEPEHPEAPACEDPSPIIRWDSFASWSDFESFIKQRSRLLFSKQQKRLEKLEQEHGPLSFEYDDRNPEAFYQCIEWKKAQYPGGHETLENPAAVDFLKSLWDQKVIVVSSLKLNGKYVAIRIAYKWGKSHFALIPAHDHAFSRYGIGKEILHRCLRASYEHGDEVFDFLLGAETYKWDYATHVHVIKPAGIMPWRTRLAINGQQLAKTILTKLSPNLYYGLKRLTLNLKYH